MNQKTITCRKTVIVFLLLLSSSTTYSLKITNEVMTEGDDGFHSVPQLHVTEMMKQVAHLKLSSFSHLHL
jgi:hypothetical protein